MKKKIKKIIKENEKKLKISNSEKKFLFDKKKETKNNREMPIFSTMFMLVVIFNYLFSFFSLKIFF